MKTNRLFSSLTVIATLLALTVIMLGAYTRLKDAGLGCPDWPGCYGQLSVPTTTKAVFQAEKLFPKQVVKASKAWLEMIHRYFAGTLGLLIFVLGIWSLSRRRKNPDQMLAIPLLLMGLVIFQAALGMWTVTWKLLPTVVMGHLLGGMAIAALLWSLALDARKKPQEHTYGNLRGFAIGGLVIVALQIFLGGWTSSNYASLICTHFPFCYGKLFPSMNFAKAFNFFLPIGQNYDGGELGTVARVTIQMAHRYGAFITAGYVGLLGCYLLFAKKAADLRLLGIAMLAVLVAQFTLGILNIEELLPLPLALAHNGVAALLLLIMVTGVYKTRKTDLLKRKAA